jgi:hypothetical protein
VRDRIDELKAEIANKAVKTASLDREARLERLAGIVSALEEVIRQRACDPELQGIPGGNTGYIVKSWKAAGKELMPEYSVDTPLVKVRLEVERQAAQELGEWLQRSAVELKGDIPVLDIPADATLEQIRAAKSKMQEALEQLTQRPQVPQVEAVQ